MSGASKAAEGQPALTCNPRPLSTVSLEGCREGAPGSGHGHARAQAHTAGNGAR